MIAKTITKARKDKKEIFHKEEIKKLSDISLVIVAENYLLYPELKNLEQKWKIKVYDKISIDHPLKITFPLINYELFWRRACKAHFVSSEKEYHGNSWKQCYAENYTKKLVSDFEVDKDDMDDIINYFQIFRFYIFNLEVSTFSSNFDISKIPQYFVNLCSLDLKYSPKLKDEESKKSIYHKQLIRKLNKFHNKY